MPTLRWWRSVRVWRRTCHPWCTPWPRRWGWSQRRSAGKRRPRTALGLSVLGQVLRPTLSVSAGRVLQPVQQRHHGDDTMTDDKLYGVQPVLAALQEGRRHIRQVLISMQRRGAEVQRIMALAERRGIPVVTVERPQL